MNHKPMNETQHGLMLDVLMQVAQERQAQHRTYGEQILPDGIWPEDEDRVELLLTKCRTEQRMDRFPPWGYVLLEEACEAALEDDPVKLRAELVQVAAVATQWVEALDRRQAAPKPTSEDRGFIAGVFARLGFRRAA